MKISKFLKKLLFVNEQKHHKVVHFLGFKILSLKKSKWENFMVKYSPFLYVGIPNNLTLQICFNNSCNCACKFCGDTGIARNTKDVQIFPLNWLYKDFLPLYSRCHHLIPTYGEITICKEGFDFLTFIDKKYHQINISLETNGIAFNEKWANLAANNLMRVNFSLNAINEDYYRKTVWDKKGVFPTIMKNFENYLALLDQRGLSEFYPSASMVVNKSNYNTCLDFIKKCLSYKLSVIVLLFDNYLFYCKQEEKIWIQNVFRELLEVERVIKDKVFLNFRLFVPFEGLNELEKEVDMLNIWELREKYSDIVTLINDYSTLKEVYVKKTRVRKEKKKKYYSYYEEITGPTFHQRVYRNRMICENPWSHLRVYPNGNTAVCSWYPCLDHQNLNNYLVKGKISWRQYFNNPFRRLQRYNFCQKNIFAVCIVVQECLIFLRKNFGKCINHKEGSMNLFLTVNVITYNHVQYIAKCLDSILEQKTTFKFIVRVFDDCSTDGTIDVCKDYARRFPDKIYFYPTEKNLGPIYNPIRAYTGIKTPYYILVEGDDYLCGEGRFQEQYEILERHPECSFCAGAALFHRIKDDCFYGKHPSGLQEGIISASAIKKFYDMYIFTRLATRMVRTKCIRLDENNADIFLSDQGQIYLLLQQGSMYFVPRVYMIYNVTGYGIYSRLNRMDKISLTFNQLVRVNNYTNCEFEDHILHEALLAVVFAREEKYNNINSLLDKKTFFENVCLLLKRLRRFLLPPVVFYFLHIPRDLYRYCKRRCKK